jgi:hypothetical protein
MLLEDIPPDDDAVRLASFHVAPSLIIKTALPPLVSYHHVFVAALGATAPTGIFPATPTGAPSEFVLGMTKVVVTTPLAG